MTQLHTMIAHERHQDLLRAAAQASLISAARAELGRAKPARRWWLRRSSEPAAPTQDHPGPCGCRPLARLH